MPESRKNKILQNNGSMHKKNRKNLFKNNSQKFTAAIKFRHIK